MKRKNRIAWLFVLFAALVGICACSATASEADKSVVSESGTSFRADSFIVEIAKAYNMIKTYYVDDIDSQKLYEGAIAGMLGSLDDPHSVYWNKKDYELWQKELLRGDFGGVGLYINKNNPESIKPDSPLQDRFVHVVAPIKGTPGYRADIHAGDHISHINGESVAELTSDEAVAKMTGKPGTKVTLTIVRGDQIVFDVTVVREMIEVPTCEYAMIDDTLAYLRILTWTQHTADSVEAALAEFKSKHYKGLIIDLRLNGGGLLDAATTVSDLFLSKGVIVSTKYKANDHYGFANQAIKASPYQTKVDDSIPIAVLIDNGTASASEILAGALQDHKRATIIGTTSYGKGSVQAPFPLSYGDCIKMTIGRYYTPSGKNIDKVGIVPDIPVEEETFSDDEVKNFADLVNGQYVEHFVEKNPDSAAAEARIPAFIAELKGKKIELEERIIRKMIRNKYYLKMDFPPVFDMEYDLTLQKAVEFFKHETVVD